MATHSYQSRKTPKPTLELDGVEFEVRGLCFFDVQDWFKLRDLELDNPEALELLADLYRRLVRDFDGFRAHCAEHMTVGAVLMAILGQFMTEAIGDVEPGADPTPRPTDSAAGPTNTGDISRAELSSPDSPLAPPTG